MSLLLRCPSSAAAGGGQFTELSSVGQFPEKKQRVCVKVDIDVVKVTDCSLRCWWDR